MDWNDFDECFAKLKTILREMLFADEGNPYKREIYGNYLGFASEIKIIVQRVETEAQEFTELIKKEMDMSRANKEIDDKELFAKQVAKLNALRLDIKSFFIFTRIFLDTLARIIGLCFGRNGRQLPWNMTKLMGHAALMKLDSNFAKGLKDKTL